MHFNKTITLCVIGLAAVMSGCSSTPTASFYAQEPLENIVSATNLTVSGFDGSYQVQGPSILNDADDDELQQSVSLRSKLDTANKTAAHQAYIQLNYIIPTQAVASWGFYEMARISGKSLSLTPIRRNSNDCDSDGCAYQETLSLNLSKKQLETALNSGLNIDLIAKSGQKHSLSFPANYVDAFLTKINRQLASQNLSTNDLHDAHRLSTQAKYGRGYAKAESLAKRLGCNKEPLKTISNEGAQAVFQTRCPGEQYRLIKCEWGNCKVLN